MSIKAVLFDLDGTLINSLPLILYAAKLTHEQMQLPYDEDYLRSTIGLPIVNTAAKLAGKRSQEYLEVYSSFCNQHQEKLIKVYPYIREMLTDLKQKGIALAVVTARRRQSTETILGFLGLQDYFQTIVCAEDTEKHKPEPEPALLALENLAIEPVAAVMVGDSPYDIDCGNAAGCATAAVTWGMGDEETLSMFKPSAMFNDAQALKKWLLKQ